MSLQSDLEDVFSSMDDGDNETFTKGLSDKIAAYVEGGTVITVDTGTVSSGVLAGAGNGSIEVDASDCKDILDKACENMDKPQDEGGKAGDADYLAEEIAKGVDKMVSNGKVKTKVNGSITTPSGSPQPVVNAEAEGGISCVPSTIETALKTAFALMEKPEDEGGKAGDDSYLAEQIATAVMTYMSAGIVSTDGKGDISGAKGTGAWTPGA